MPVRALIPSSWPQDPVAAYMHKRHQPPVVNPPRSPVADGIMVVFGPRDKTDDPNLPANTVFKTKVVLPLTPGSIQIQGQSTWTDGIFSVRGHGPGVLGGAAGWNGEYAQYGGGQLENISFSGRLEPPAYYISSKRVHPISDVSTSGRWTPMAMDHVRDGQGVLHSVNAGIVGGPIDVNAETALQARYNQGTWDANSGGATFAQPPTLPGGTDVVMQAGGIAPPGYSWHEPHVLADMLLDICKSGEIIRCIIGDQYGYNRMVSVRTFTYRAEDPDPDVINFDISLRQHRPLPRPPANAKPHPKSYKTKKGDTLHKIAQLEMGNVTLDKRIVQYNRHKLEMLWIDPDGRAVAPTYFPKLESVGPFWAGHKGGRRVGSLKRYPSSGFGPQTYLRGGITLSLVPPPPPKRKKNK